MKRAFTALLVLLLALGLCACKNSSGETSSQPKSLMSVSAYKSQGSFEKLQGQLTWEGISAFPIKSADMTTEELRSLCVDFFRFSKTALWVPAEEYVIYNSKGVEARRVEKGVVYGGLPYVGVASGNVYRLLDYMDPETGVVNVTAAGRNPELFGNQCSIAAWWGWARAINSANYEWTYHCVTSRNFPYVGERLYDDALERFDDDYGTDEVLRETDMQKVFECYALLKKGDGIMYYTTAGHVVMISSDAHVERLSDGSIDPSRSYVTVLDQTTEWTDGVNEFGENYVYEANVDAKWTFMSMHTGNYLPFTYHEFLGDDPVEETEIQLNHQGDTITKEQIYKTGVKANYSLVDLYATFHDEAGNELLKIAASAEKADRRELYFTDSDKAQNMYHWGSWENLTPGETYTVTISAQLGTGERPTLWEGKLAQ